MNTITETKPKTILQIQLEALSRHLKDIKKQDVFNLSMRIYPVISSQLPYMSLYSAIKKQVLLIRSKGASFSQIQSDLITKANAVGEQLGKQITQLLREQPQFLPRFECSSTHGSLQRPLAMNDAKDDKKEVAQHHNCMDNHNEGFLEHKLPLKCDKSPFQQKITPVSGPIRNDFFLDSPLLIGKDPQLVDDFNVYKIGNRPETKSAFPNNYIDWSQIVGNSAKNNEKAKLITIGNDKASSAFEAKIDTLVHKKNYDHIINSIEDPLSSARPATVSPQKPLYSSQQQSNKSFVFPPPVSKSSFFGSSHQQKSNAKTVEKYLIDSNAIRNISERSLCLCEALCEDINLSQDSFKCTHCENVYHTRCMKRTQDAKHCSICQLRLMIPNKVVCQELFVGVLKKGKKRHEIHFTLTQDLVSFLKSKKDFSYRLQLRSARLKPQTQNQSLFPDSCTISINTKELKEFKPLHKQSSLKYRRDEPIPIFKNYHTGENKITVTQFHNSSVGGIERIQPEDHLIGLYMIEEEQLNTTVERIIKNFVTTCQDSKQLLNKAFYINDNSGKYEDGEMSESDAISCEVVKIPLTCALTTEKLNYPARGFLCTHFQCFDLKNFIMMTSSSSNPRWVCPICKAPCYQFRIDCILTQILNEYTGCSKVETLVLYKDGAYQVLDKDEDPIDHKGHKLKQQQPKNISQLKIVDLLKRERQKQAELQLLKLQQAEKKKKRIIQFPPEDQIVSLLSDSD